MQVKISQVPQSLLFTNLYFNFFSPSVSARRGENGLIGGHLFLPEESDGSCRVLSCLSRWITYSESITLANVSVRELLLKHKCSLN